MRSFRSAEANVSHGSREAALPIWGWFFEANYFLFWGKSIRNTATPICWGVPLNKSFGFFLHNHITHAWSRRRASHLRGGGGEAATAGSDTLWHGQAGQGAELRQIPCDRKGDSFFFDSPKWWFSPTESFLCLVGPLQNGGFLRQNPHLFFFLVGPLRSGGFLRQNPFLLRSDPPKWWFAPTLKWWLSFEIMFSLR